MAGEDDIVIRAILEDELSDPAERIERALDNLGRSNRRASEETDNLSESQRRNRDETERNTRTTQDQSRTRDDNSDRTRENTRQTDENTRSTRSNTRERDKSSKSGKRSTDVFKKLSGVLMPVGKAFLLLDALGTAAPGLVALGSGAIAAGSGLAQMSGAPLPLPALLLGAAQAFGVFKLATNGMGKAIAALASGDYAKFGELTKDMNPAAIATAKSFGVLGQQFKSIKQDIQGAVFADIAPQIDNLGGKLLPMLRTSFMQTGVAINGAMKDVLGFANSGKGLTQIRSILQGTGQISADAAKGTGQLAIGVIGMANAVMPVAKEMSEVLLQGVTALTASIQNNQAKITAFAQRGFDLFSRFVGILVDVGKGIYNIAKNAGGLAGSLGGGLERGAKAFRDWTASAKGQAKIQQMFKDAQPILAALGRLINAVGKAIFDMASSKNAGNLVGLIDKLTDMVPTIANLANQASGQFLPSLLKIADAILSIVDNMNAMGPMSILMSAVAEPTQILADAFDKLPGPIQTAIGYMVMFGLAVRAMAANAAGAWLLNALGLTAWGNYFKLVMQTAILRLKEFMLAQLAAARAKIGGALAAGWRGIATAIGTATKAVWAFSKATLAFLFTNPFGLIILAVIALVVAFVILWKKSEAFRNMIKAIGAWFVSVWNNQIKPLVFATWEWMKTAWNAVWNVTKQVIGWIVNFFKSAWNIIKGVATTVFGVIAAVFKVVMTILTVYFKVWWTVVKFGLTILVGIFKIAWLVVSSVFKVVFAVMSTVFAVWWAVIRVAILILVAIFKLAWLAIKIAFMVVFNVMKSIFLAFVAVIRVAIAVIVAVWTVAFNIVKAVVVAVINVIRAIIGFLAPYVMMIVNSIVNIFRFGWNIVSTVVMFAVGIIRGIINTIIGIVQTVMGIVGSVFSSAWNFVAGVVGSVIGGIRGVIDTIAGVVGRVTGAVRNAFQTAFGAVRDFVNPILDGIMSFLNSIKSAAESVVNTVSNIVDKIPGFALGGSPTVGTPSLVGEVGPEAFVTHTGKVSLIGQNGPEIRKFNQPGYVVPNHVLRGGSDASVPRGVMNKLYSAMSSDGGASADVGASYGHARANLSSNTYMSDAGGSGGGVHVDFRGATFGGSAGDVKQAVIDALEEVDRNRRERS